ncbi:MAG: response regulator [Pseudomonadota bacterium]
MTGQLNILIAEDSDDDYEFLTRAIKRSDFATSTVSRARTGQELIDEVTGLVKTDAPKPDLILLDLNMPGVDGREALTHLKNNVDTRAIPVVIMTTSNSEQDLRSCYLGGANSYVQKPLDFSELVEAVDSITKYWFDTVLLPSSYANR